MKAWVLVKKKNKQTNKRQKSSPFCLVTNGYVIGDRWPVIAGTSEERTPDPMGATEIEPSHFYSFYSFRQMDFNNWNLFWSLCFGLLSFLIIVGNALSISILFKRRLRKRPHFLLISLAFADLLVGLIPVPLFIMIQANLLLHTAYWAYLCVDMITGLSSVFTLTAIYFPRKTTRHFSPSSPSTTHLTQLWDCHSNPMDLLPVVILFALSFFRYNLPSVQLWDNY